MISFLILTIILIFGSINAHAATLGRIYYSVDNSSITVGQDFNIYINADNLTDLYGQQIDFSFDSTLIQVNSIQAGSFYSNKIAGVDYMLVNQATQTPGLIRKAILLIGNKYQTGLNVPVASQLFVIKAHALKAGTIALNAITNGGNLSASGNNVCVKLANSNGQGIAYSATSNTITINSISINSFVPDKASPQLAGIPITLTANASGASGILYRFHVFDGTSWSIVQNFSTNNKLSWTPSKSGTYRFSVNVKQSTASDSSIIYKTIDNYVVNTPKLVINSFVADKASPQLTATPVTLTATASGAFGVTYRFHVFDGTSWSIVQNFSTNNKLIWTPSKPGTYRFSVNVKQSTAADSSIIYKTIDNYVVNTPKLVINSFVADKASPQLTATPVTLTATSSGASGVTYRFHVFDGTILVYSSKFFY